MHVHALQRGMAQCGMAWHSTVRPCLEQRSTALHCTAWRDAAAQRGTQASLISPLVIYELAIRLRNRCRHRREETRVQLAKEERQHNKALGIRSDSTSQSSTTKARSRTNGDSQKPGKEMAQLSGTAGVKNFLSFDNGSNNSSIISLQTRQLRQTGSLSGATTHTHLEQ